MLEYSHARNCPFCGHQFVLKATAEHPVILEENVMNWADSVAMHMQSCIQEKEYAKSVKTN